MAWAQPGADRPRSVTLTMRHQIHEVRDGHEPGALRREVRRLDRRRHDQLHALLQHLVGLVQRGAGLERDQVLGFNPARFGQHRPPSILQGRLGRELGKPEREQMLEVTG